MQNVDDERGADRQALRVSLHLSTRGTLLLLDRLYVIFCWDPRSQEKLFLAAYWRPTVSPTLGPSAWLHSVLSEDLQVALRCQLRILYFVTIHFRSLNPRSRLPVWVSHAHRSVTVQATSNLRCCCEVYYLIRYDTMTYVLEQLAASVFNVDSEDKSVISSET
jgi:hypothetical protein